MMFLHIIISTFVLILTYLQEGYQVLGIFEVNIHILVYPKIPQV